MVQVKSWRQLNKGRRSTSKWWLKLFSFFVSLGARRFNKKEENPKQIPSDITSDKNKWTFFYQEKITTAVKKAAKKAKTSKQVRQIRTPYHSSASSFSWVWVISGILLLISVVMVIGAWRFITSRSASVDDLLLTMDGPQQIAPGEEVTFTVVYRNVSEITLRKLELTVKYPQGMKIKSVVPQAANEFQTIWNLGDLAPGQSGEVQISAQVFTKNEGEDKFEVSLIYQPQNFSSDFIKKITYPVRIGTALFALQMEAPSRLLPDTESDFIIKWEKLTTDKFTDIYLRLAVGNNFTITEAEIDPEKIDKLDKDKVYWWNLLDDFNSSLSFKGKFSSGSKGVQKLRWELVRQEGDQARVLQEKEFDLFIVGEELILTMDLNGKEEVSSLSPGSELNYNINIKNISGQRLGNLEVILHLSPSLIDWSYLQAPAEPKITEAGEIVLLPGKMPALAELPVDQELNISIKTRLKDNIPSGAKLRSYVTVKVGMVGEEVKEDLSFSSTEIISNIVTPLSFHAGAFYYDDEGAKIGSGAWPPQVGKSTELVLSWFLRSQADSVDDIKVSAILPPGVVWLGTAGVDKGSFNYRESDRQLSWQVDSLTEAEGEITANFRVAVNPTLSSVGQFLPLLSASKLTAKLDGNMMTLSAPALDTSLSGSLYGSSEGRVIQ